MKRPALLNGKTVAGEQVQYLRKLLIDTADISEGERINIQRKIDELNRAIHKN